MEQIPFGEANRFLASQKISRVLWNAKIHYPSTRARHLSHPEPDQSSSCLPFPVPEDPFTKIKDIDLYGVDAR